MHASWSETSTRANAICGTLSVNLTYANATGATLSASVICGTLNAIHEISNASATGAISIESVIRVNETCAI